MILKQSNLKISFYEDLLTAVLKSGTSFDFRISEHEYDALILRLRSYDNFTIDERRFRKCFANGELSMKGLMNIFHGLENDDERGIVKLRRLS